MSFDFKELQTKFKKHSFHLSTYKSLFIEELNVLCIADWHLGKSTHFRKHGAAIPSTHVKAEVERILFLLDYYQPHQFLILGDLFHSHTNKEVKVLDVLQGKLPEKTYLIEGNHDIFIKQTIKNLLIKSEIKIGDFLFTHIPRYDNDAVTISGHIHPGVALSLNSNATKRFPCFAFTSNQVILPSFGIFTGMHTIKLEDYKRIFVLDKSNILNLK